MGVVTRAVYLALLASSMAHCARLREPTDQYTLLQLLPDDVIAATRAMRPAAGDAHSRDAPLVSPEAIQHIRDTMDLWGVRGVSLAVVRRRNDSDGFDVETHAFGTRDRDGAPMTTDTLVPIASNSKAFTVAAAGLLVDRDDVPLQWNSKLRDIFDGFSMQDPVANALTSVEDFLSHRTGLPRHDGLFGLPVDNPMDFSLDIVKHLNPSSEFRNVYQYCNHGFNICASVVARLSGAPFVEFVTKHIFEPAGFKSTTYNITEAIKNGVLTEGFWLQGETVDNKGKWYSSWPNVDNHVGAGGILSNANDMAIWLQTLLNNGKSPATGKQVIPPKVLDAMAAGRTVAASAGRLPELGPLVYGMGFMSSSYQGHQFIEHGGALQGYRTQITRFPNDGLGIAVLVNEERGVYAYDAIKWRIAEELLGMPHRVDWNQRYKEVHAAELQQQADEEAGRMPSPPDAKFPDAPLERISAAYSNAAYGKLAFKVTGDGVLRAQTPQWDSLPVTLALKHFNGNVFNATMPVLVKAIGHDEPILDRTMHLQAEFEIVDGVVTGFGLWGGLWGAGAGVESGRGGTPREKAEIWFDRDNWPWNAGETSSPEAQVVLSV